MKTDAGLGWLKSIFKVARESFDDEVKNFFKISFHAVDCATDQLPTISMKLSSNKFAETSTDLAHRPPHS